MKTTSFSPCLRQALGKQKYAQNDFWREFAMIRLLCLLSARTETVCPPYRKAYERPS